MPDCEEALPTCLPVSQQSDLKGSCASNNKHDNNEFSRDELQEFSNLLTEHLMTERKYNPCSLTQRLPVGLEASPK